jgi:3-oxoacyl-[acyl-carrier protein] reductase
MNLELREKSCIVTGGTRNLGRAVVLRLLQEGAKVVATFLRDHTSAKELVMAIPADRRSNLHVCNVDISADSGCNELCALAVEKFGRLDIVINNAAATIVQPPDEITDTDFDTIFHNTLRSTIYMSRAAFGAMKPDGGRIVNMSTAGVYTANPNELLYICAKAGVEAATRAFARLGARRKITVNALAAHVISSGMGVHTVRMDPTILDRIPLRRMGRIDEFVSLVLCLASPTCEYMTGQVIHLNGGRLMQ